MKVALTVNDFLDRALAVYGDRVGLVDEPDQPAESWGRSPTRRSGSALGRRPPGSTHWVSRRGSASRWSRTTPAGC